jgi:hypothetical protein
MTSQISLRVALLGLALMLFAAVGAKASHVDNARAGHSTVVAAVAPSGMAAMNSANILFQLNDDQDKRNRHVVTPEPASWLYILGAGLLVLLWERKSLKSRFGN